MLQQSRSSNSFGFRVGALAFALSIYLFCGAGAAADIILTTPEATVDSLHRGLVEVASGGEASDVEARFTTLLPLVQGTHDIRYIAELSVRRDWQEFDSEQRVRFTDAFAELSAMTYAARFGNVTEQTFVRLESEEANAERMTIYTLIKRKEGEDVTLDYLLQLNASGWQIINIVADGVSDLALKRSEYRSVLADGSIEELIDYVEDQIGELRSDR